MEEKDKIKIRRKKAIIETMAFLFINYIILIISFFIEGCDTYYFLRTIDLQLQEGTIIPLLACLYILIIWTDLKTRNILAGIVLILFTIKKGKFDMWIDDFTSGMIFNHKNFLDLNFQIIMVSELLLIISQFFIFVLIERKFKKRFKIDKNKEKNQMIKNEKEVVEFDKV